jgi:hypothetical protein
LSLISDFLYLHGRWQELWTICRWCLIRARNFLDCGYPISSLLSLQVLRLLHLLDFFDCNFH